MRRRIIIKYTTDCRSLILIDAEPIKKAEQRKCQQVIRQMDRAREDLRRFSEKSQPAFNQWLHSTFGKEITGLRELAQRHHELQQLVSEVEEFKDCFGGSYHKAYEAVLKRRSQPQQEESFNHDQDHHGQNEHTHGFSPREEAELRAEFDAFFGSMHGHGSKAEYDAMFQEFMASFEGMTDEFDENDPSDATFSGGPIFDEQAGVEIKSQETRLKDLYRTLARRLHPDINPDVDQKRKDLWHDVQAAYDAKDIERLETLSAMDNIYDNNLQSIGSVWSLKSLCRELRSGLRQLQKQIRQTRNEPAWNFEIIQERPEKLRQLHVTLARQMDGDRVELEDAIQYGDNLINKWKQQPKPHRPKAPRSHIPKMIRKHQRSQWTKADMDAFTGFGREA